MRLVLPNRNGLWVTVKAQKVRCSDCSKQELTHFLCRPQKEAWNVGMSCSCGFEEWRVCSDEEVMKLGEALQGWTTAEEFADDSR